MRRFLRAGVIGLSVVAIVAVAPMASASAGEVQRGTLKVCLKQMSEPFGPKLEDIQVSADGPSWRTKKLDQNQCKSWRVRAGSYEIDAELRAEFAQCYIDRATIKRNGKKATVRDLDGRFTTNVRADKKTTIKLFADCADFSEPVE